MKVLIGTKNPGKIQGAKEALEKYYENIDIEGIPVSSDVSEQPLNEEIYLGAKNGNSGIDYHRHRPFDGRICCCSMQGLSN